jgi:hypothetical protein
MRCVFAKLVMLKKQHDAEIMVKECVPIEYIVNIDNPDEF